MPTIFKYDANNFMKAEINKMSGKRRRNIFKLMNLLGDFSLVTNLYIVDNDLNGTVTVFTYDKDDSKLTFFPRSLNKSLQNLVLINELQHCEAYSIENMSLLNSDISELKVGEVFDISEGKLIINESDNLCNISILFYSGLTYTVDFIFGELNFKEFVNNLNKFKNIEFKEFIDFVLKNSKAYEYRFQCKNNEEILSDLKINNGEYQEVAAFKNNENLARVLVKKDVKKN